MIKIGIIGHGFMGHEHEAMLSQLEGYQLVGFSDRDRSVLEDVRPGLKRYESNEALLRETQRSFQRYAFPSAKETQFALAELGNDAGIYGAAYLVLQHQHLKEGWMIR